MSGLVLANINEVVDSALQFLTFEHRADGIEIVRNFGENCLTRCDKNQMEQVFLNLFTNACDAMAGSGKLVLTTENSENYIRVSVRDTGPGIPEEYMNWLGINATAEDYPIISVKKPALFGPNCKGQPE